MLPGAMRLSRAIADDVLLAEPDANRLAAAWTILGPEMPALPLPLPLPPCFFPPLLVAPLLGMLDVLMLLPPAPLALRGAI